MTLAEASAKLAIWQAAVDAIAGSQEYRIGTRQIRRADLDDCLKMVKYYEGEVTRLTAGRRRGARVMRAVPRDL